MPPESINYLLTDRLTYVILAPSVFAPESSMNDKSKDLIPGVFEASLEAHLRAVRRLRQGEAAPAEPRRREGRSQVDMAFDILRHPDLHGNYIEPIS